MGLEVRLIEINYISGDLSFPQIERKTRVVRPALQLNQSSSVASAAVSTERLEDQMTRLSA